ncbi:hypothetical protein [Hymenobacter terrigena]
MLVHYFQDHIRQAAALPHAYQFVDPAIAHYAASPVYYRLKQVNLNGTFSYSPVRTVAVSGHAGLALFPNPTTRATALTGVQPGTVVTVFDAIGRQVTAAPPTRALPAPIARPSTPAPCPKEITGNTP